MAAKRERGIRPLPDGRWLWCYTDPAGKFHRNRARSKGEARAFLEKVRTEIREGRWLDRRRECKTIFEQAAARFLEWSKATRSDRTWRGDCRYAKRWTASPFFAGKPLDKITGADVEQYRQSYLGKKVDNGSKPERDLARRSIDIELARLKRLFSLAVQWGLCEKNPAAKVALFRQDVKRIRYLSEEEERRLFAAAGPRLRRIIRFALNTGMRRGEILGLRWCNVDLKSAGAFIPATEAKGKRDRHVPLNQTALSVLNELPRPIDNTAFVFGNKAGKRDDNLERLWREAAQAAGLVDFHFHDLRHTYASRLVMAGVDLAVLRELLGHQDFSMTLRYAHLAPSRLKEAVAILDSNRHETGTAKNGPPEELQAEGLHHA
jgi:integrase